MSGVLLFSIRIGILVVLWLFIITVISLIRDDVFGKSIKKKSSKSVPHNDSNPSVVAVISGPNSGKTFKITTQEMTIGRGQEATIILDDKILSRIHARIFHSNNGVYIEDMGSSNGTIVNKTDLHSNAFPDSNVKTKQLFVGDNIKIGKTVLKLI
ncbi:MAG: FHA domain-containing protein [Bifidobacteriaceae bacterium]|jgi:hypothetical protein|nr:FHA domain-containing protein [Bifidobacteriaceae bacterium]